MPPLPDHPGTQSEEKVMKPLFISIAAVAAISLWYSSAQARENNHQSNARHSYQQNHHASPQARHNTNNRFSQHSSQQWNRNAGHRDVRHSDHASQSGRDNRFADNRRTVNHTQWNQHQRIQQASHNGSLTGSERRSLGGEQRAIAAKEQQYRSDGRLSGVERRDLRSDQVIASRNIYNESHDAERRNLRP